MGQRLFSFRWHTLTRKGFIIVTPALQAKEPQGWADVMSARLRHPASLVVLGFLCTGVIGKYLTDRQNEQLRQRQALNASMDVLRSGMRDLSAAFSDYKQHALDYITLRQSDAPLNELDLAKSLYKASLNEVRQKLAVNGPDIKQRFPVAAKDHTMTDLLRRLETSLSEADTCILKGTLRDKRTPDQDGTRQLMCIDANSRDDDAAFRVFMLYSCSMFVTEGLRPNPASEYAAGRTNANLAIRAPYFLKACNIRK